MSRSQDNQWQARENTNLAWRYALLFTLLVVSGPTLHYINQYRRGHPLDIHYFWSEFSPQAFFGQGLYNGPGGSDWKIGKPLATTWNADSFRSLPELRTFALQLVNRDRILNNLQPLVEDPLLSKAAQRHAEDMLKRQYFEHVSPEGKTPRDRFLAVGGSPYVAIGENIILSNNWSLDYDGKERRVGKQ